MVLPFHTPGEVTSGGQVLNKDGTVNEARTKDLAKRLKWTPSKGSMTPAMARAGNTNRQTSDKRRKGAPE